MSLPSRWNADKQRWEPDGPMDHGAFWLLVLVFGFIAVTSAAVLIAMLVKAVV